MSTSILISNLNGRLEDTLIVFVECELIMERGRCHSGRHNQERNCKKHEIILCLLAPTKSQREDLSSFEPQTKTEGNNRRQSS